MFFRFLKLYKWHQILQSVSFLLHLTVTLFEFDVGQPRYRLDIFPMVPKKVMLEKVNQKVMLSEKDLLLSHLHEHSVSNETVSDTNILRDAPNKYSQKFDYD